MKKFQFALLLVLLCFLNQSQAAPVLIVQGESTSDSPVLVSNDGRWVVDGNQIFDGRNGLQWGGIPAGANASSEFFTPDTTRVLVVEKVKPPIDPDYWRVIMYSVPSGHKMRSIEHAPYPLWCDNTRFRGIEGDTLIEVDLKTGQKKSVKIQDVPKEVDDPKFAFSQNGKFLVEGKTDVIRWWSAADGRIKGRFDVKGRSDDLTGISNDGKRIVSQHQEYEPGPGIIYVRSEMGFGVYIWNVDTRKVIRKFEESGPAKEFRFSADGNKLLSRSVDLHHFDLRTGKDSPPVNSKADLTQVAFSNDGKWLSGYGKEGHLQLWSVDKKKLAATFPLALPWFGKITWSPDGKYLLCGRNLLWDAHSGKIVGYRPYNGNEDEEVFSWFDSKTIRTQGSHGFHLWSVPDFKLKFSFDVTPPRKDETSHAYYGGISIAPDGKTALTTNVEDDQGRNELWVWDVSTKKVVRKIKIPDADWNSERLSLLAWLTDNRRVVFSVQNKEFNSPGRLILLDIQSGVIEKELSDAIFYNSDTRSKTIYFKVVSFRISPDGKWLAVFMRDRPAEAVFDLEDWYMNPPEGVAWWKKVHPGRRFPDAPPASGELSPNGRLAAYTNSDYQTHDVWESPEKQLVGVSIWSIATRREVVRLYVTGEPKGKLPDWIAVTPQGYYDASTEGEKRLRWREGNEFWPITKSRARFKRPDMVAKALNP